MMTIGQYEIADLCSGAGLAADGYAAVFGAPAMYGYDINPQPDYPYVFKQADALELLQDQALDGYDAIHTSFPCQFHTTGKHLRKAQGGESKYLDLLTPGLDLLRRNYSHVPWIVENVDDNTKSVRKIMDPRPGESLVLLCGTMFGLPIWRHRLFLANFPIRAALPTGPGIYGGYGCRHYICPPDPTTGRPRPWGIYHVPGDSIPSGGRTALDADHARELMGVARSLPWESLKEGFPPAYTAWVGADLLRALQG